MYLLSKPYITWKIPTGIEVGEYGDLIYTPDVSVEFPHEFSRWPLAEFRKGPFLNWGHNLGFSRINWIGNFRRGFYVNADNSYSYSFYYSGTKAISSNYSITGIGHFIMNDSFGISGRLQFRQWFLHDPDYYDEAGDAVRGVLNRSVNANYMLSLNIDVPVKVLEFRPSSWLDSRMRVIDFDLHLVPILDFAIYNDPKNDVSFDLRNTLITAGVEFIIYPVIMRSVYIRFSVAANASQQLKALTSIPSANNREIFIGMGHHF
jgi:hypothetical protein